MDDILHLGLYSFDEGVMKPLKEAFYFGSEEEEKFRYMGLNMEQTADGIIVNQDHYVKELELPDMDVAKNLKAEEVHDKGGQKEFR